MNSEKRRKARVNSGFESSNDYLRYIGSGVGKRKDRISVSDGTRKERGMYFAQIRIMRYYASYQVVFARNFTEASHTPQVHSQTI